MTSRQTLRQHSGAECHKKHRRRKDEYHGTHTPVEELIAIEGHFTPPGTRYGSVTLLKIVSRRYPQTARNITTRMRSKN